VDVLDVGWDLVDLMATGVQDRGLIAALAQAVDDEWPGRAGAADDKCGELAAGGA
jgi:hypothetical protein